MSKTAAETRYWHFSNGQLYTGRNGLELDEYKASLRRAYGSLRGVKVIEASDEESAYKLAHFGVGAVSMTFTETGEQIARQGFARFV